MPAQAGTRADSGGWWGWVPACAGMTGPGGAAFALARLGAWARLLLARGRCYFLATSGHFEAASGWKASAAGMVARTW